MEWENINSQAIEEVTSHLSTSKETKEFLQQKNNFFRIGQKVISLAEQHKIMLEYTTLNDDFIKRLKDENRYVDPKKIGEKRPILESPSPKRRTKATKRQKTKW